MMKLMFFQYPFWDSAPLSGVVGVASLLLSIPFLGFIKSGSFVRSRVQS